MALQHGAEFLQQDQQKLLEYLVPLGGLYDAGDPGFADSSGRTPRGKAKTAVGVFFREGGVLAGLSSQQLGDTPWAGAGAYHFGLGQYREQSVTDGTVSRYHIAAWRGPLSTNLRIYSLAPGATTWTARNSSTLATSSLQPFMFAQAGNRLFAVNGKNWKVWNKSSDANMVNAWQSKPASAPTSNADPEDNTASGVLIAGKIYYLGYSWYSSTTGDESNLSPILQRTFTGAAGDDTWQVDFPAATPEAHMDKIKVYISEPYDVALGSSAEATLRYEQTITWNVAGLTDQSVGIIARSLLGDKAPQPGATRDYSIIKSVRGITFWDGRLWAWGVLADSFNSASGGSLVFSDRDNLFGWPLRNELKAEFGSGDDIRAVVPYNGRLYVFAPQRCFEVQPNPAFASSIDTAAPPYVLKPLTGSFGATSMYSVCEAWGHLYGIEYGRIWKFDGYQWQDVGRDVEDRIRDSLLVPLSGGPGWVYPNYISWRRGPNVECLVIASHIEGTNTFLTMDRDGNFALHFGDSGCYLCFEATRGGSLLLAQNQVTGKVMEHWFSRTETLIPSTGSSGVECQYEPVQIDPDPTVEYKLFDRIEIKLARSPLAGLIGVTFKFDGQSFSLATTDYVEIALPTDAESEWIVETVKLPARRAWRSLKMFIQSLAPAYARWHILELRVFWKPWGER